MSRQGPVSDAGDLVAAAINLQDWATPNHPLQTASGCEDLLRWALRAVDWEAVAEAFTPEGGGDV